MHPPIPHSLAIDWLRRETEPAVRSHRADARRRTRRVLLVTALAVAALPAAAQAGVVEEAPGGTLVYRAGAGESNNVSVFRSAVNSDVIEIRDLGGLSSRTGLCSPVSSIRVRCALGIKLGEVQLGDRNDNVNIAVPNPVVVDGGPGNDGYTAASSPVATRVTFRGGDGSDVVSASSSDRGVRLSNNGLADDGRVGFDFDNVMGDVESLTGSRLADEIIAASSAAAGLCCSSTPVQFIDGSLGDDVLRAGAGAGQITSFEMGRLADGADRVVGAPFANSIVDYSGRTRPVNVTLNFGGPDDGEAGERDEITGSNEEVFGSQADDTIRTTPTSTVPLSVFANAGNDRIEGGAANDQLTGDAGADTIAAGGGDDRIFANDGFGDVIGCGIGIDTIDLDAQDIVGGCESRRVGVLRLTPRTVRAEAGKPVRLRLSWRHPVSWRKLRKVELRLIRGGAEVGSVAVHPCSGRLAAAGAAQLLRKRSRLTRRGKTVATRLALRLDERLAGQMLKVEVEATDARGARQLEPDAGTVRVAR
jgi:RTX calcium-binding nonapeptide repeat (4 copies)